MNAPLPGQPWPLGATPGPTRTNFALYAPDARRVELCLFDDSSGTERARVTMPACTDGVWHGEFDGVTAGAVYGYRVHGPWAVAMGHRFNAAKLLVDPYAREIVGRYEGSELFLDCDPDDAAKPDPRDNAAVALKARVCADAAPLDESAHVRVPRERTVLCEAHVRSMTRLHPDIPPDLRGTYAGLVHPTMLAHLRRLGVTTLGLMPLMQRVDEPRLLKLGLTNHWGYNTIGWFCAEPRLWSGRAGTTPQSECREMVRALHAAGFEVILDVVFNHSAESDLQGPTLSLRGIGNRAYYYLRRDDPAQYENWSGCGNCLNLAQPRVLQLVMDALRFWVRQIGIDGFRFDLAPILARNAQGFQPDSALFAALQQDPELSRAKLIAEPWDIGPGGYRLGEFPRGWQEWNDHYRDAVRRFWLRGDISRAQFVDAIAGSNARFGPSGRDATTSINFVTAHDGFTLRDLVSYERRHNEANGENNRDGHGDNHSTNCGVEGDTDDAAVLRRRQGLQRALLATLLLSVGTPQLLAGDEIGHTQRGNNNAYCQDNATTWLGWADADAALTEFVAECVALRKRHGVLCRTRWLTDADVQWLGNDGVPLHEHHWHSIDGRALAALYFDAQEGPDAGREPVLLVMFNAAQYPVDFVLPALPGRGWTAVLDSAYPPVRTELVLPSTSDGSSVSVAAGSVLVAEPRPPA